MSSKIIICLDGTGNDPEDAIQEVSKNGVVEDDNISNVLKFHLLAGGNLENDQLSKKQKSFYYSGVGTKGTIFRRTLASMFANFEPKWIRDKAYKDLCNNYRDGDQIYIFGFSRGAAIARMLASKISDEGINDHNPTIKLLGVWDTVAAMGAPNLKDNTRPISDVLFENGTIADAIENAIHLVAIDERRKAFRPILMNTSNKVEEVWFSGVHSDIGGGYNKDGLSDITLEFMLHRASAQGLEFLKSEEIEYSKINEKEALLEEDDVKLDPNILEDIHYQERSKGASKVTLAERVICVTENDKPSNQHLPIIHYTVKDRIEQVAAYAPDNLKSLQHYILDESNELAQYAGSKSY